MPSRHACQDFVPASGTAPVKQPSSIANWLRESFSPGTIITILTIVCALAVAHGRDEQRMDQLEAQQREVKSTYTLKSESDSQEKWLRDRLGRIEAQLDSIFRLQMEHAGK